MFLNSPFWWDNFTLSEIHLLARKVITLHYSLFSIIYLRYKIKSPWVSSSFVFVLGWFTQFMVFRPGRNPISLLFYFLALLKSPFGGKKFCLELITTISRLNLLLCTFILFSLSNYFLFFTYHINLSAFHLGILVNFYYVLYLVSCVTGQSTPWVCWQNYMSRSTLISYFITSVFRTRPHSNLNTFFSSGCFLAN